MNELKNYCRISGDDDDEQLLAMQGAAIALIENQTGKTYIQDNKIWNQAIKSLVLHWYDNRGEQMQGTYSDISFSAQMLIKQIALSSAFDGVTT